MNSIIMVEGNLDLAPNTYKIIYPLDTELNITEDTHYINYNPFNYDLHLNIKDNVNLKFDKYDDIERDMEIKINMGSNATLELNLLFINKGINDVRITINMLGNNSKAIIKARVLNQEDYSKIALTCDGVIADNTTNNELIEDLKGLVFGNSMIEINPNIEVATNDVVANHLVTIGSFNEEELFYLKSKGLSEETAKKLLIDSFIYANLNEHLKKHLDTEVINYE